MKLLLGVFGGLGLFLFGMRLMSEGLQRAAGDKLRKMIELLTYNRYIAIVTGIVVTMLVQSSSITTVMVVGFANSGLMTLSRAIGTILGARIGTTITAQIIAFKITEAALPIIGVGVVMAIFLKKKIHRNIGRAIIGFGLLFLGLTVMGGHLSEIKNNPAILELLATFGTNRVLGIIAGALFTAIIQSSSATTGVIIVLSSQGVLSLDAGLALALGSCVGTTATALLSSIGTNVTARRVAVAHAIFNTMGAVIFVWFLGPIADLVRMTSTELPRQIAWGHTFFAVVSTIIYLPFIPLFLKLIIAIVPGEEVESQVGAKFLDSRLISTPPMALAAAKKEIERMGGFASEMVQDSMTMLFARKPDMMAVIDGKEGILDGLEADIAVYLSEIAQKSITPHQGQELANYFHAINDIERIGDHAMNIAQLCEEKIDKELPFSDEAMEEIREMYGKAIEINNNALAALVNWDAYLAQEVIVFDQEIDNMEKMLRESHIYRSKTGQCFPPSGVIFLDIIANLERIGDHSVNIAQLVLGKQYSSRAEALGRRVDSAI